MDWGVFVQRQVSPELVVIRDVGCDDAAEMSLAEHEEMVETLRRIEPISRSTNPFCQGDRGAVGRSRMPMHLRRRVTTSP
jgi:hypothetical protein